MIIVLDAIKLVLLVWFVNTERILEGFINSFDLLSLLVSPYLVTYVLTPLTLIVWAPADLHLFLRLIP